MLFLCQFPHFMAIAWIYRDDYDRARYLVSSSRGESFHGVAANTGFHRPPNIRLIKRFSLARDQDRRIRGGVI